MKLIRLLLLFFVIVSNSSAKEPEELFLQALDGENFSDSDLRQIDSFTDNNVRTILHIQGLALEESSADLEAAFKIGAKFVAIKSSKDWAVEVVEAQLVVLAMLLGKDDYVDAAMPKLLEDGSFSELTKADHGMVSTLLQFHQVDRDKVGSFMRARLRNALGELASKRTRPESESSNTADLQPVSKNSSTKAVTVHDAPSGNGLERNGVLVWSSIAGVVLGFLALGYAWTRSRSDF